VEQLFAPGEPEWRRRQRSGGNIQLEPAVAAMLARFAHELGVTATRLHESMKEQRYG